MPQMTPEDVKQLRIDLYTKVADIVETFKLKTGFSPSGISVNVVSTETYSKGSDFVVAGVSLEWKL